MKPYRKDEPAPECTTRSPTTLQIYRQGLKGLGLDLLGNIGESLKISAAVCAYVVVTVTPIAVLVGTIDWLHYQIVNRGAAALNLPPRRKEHFLVDDPNEGNSLRIMYGLSWCFTFLELLWLLIHARK